MAKWTFEPVAAEEWAAEADSVFWKRFKRQHHSRQATMLERQLPVLEETAATVLAETFAFDDEVEARTRDTAFAFLVERALEQDQPLTAAELVGWFAPVDMRGLIASLDARLLMALCRCGSTSCSTELP